MGAWSTAIATLTTAIASIAVKLLIAAMHAVALLVVASVARCGIATMRAIAMYAVAFAMG